MTRGSAGPVAGLVATSNLAVTVIIPTVGRRLSLDRLLDALGRQDLDPALFETIVVVNGPAATGWPDAAPDQPAVQVIRRSEPGRAGACNAGLRLARGRIVVFLDDDMEPLPACLRAHRDAHRGPAQLILGPVPVAPDDRGGSANHYIASQFDRHLAKLARPDYVPEPSDAYTGNASIERDALLAVRGFDERLVEYGNEDRDLARRLRRSGVDIAVAPDAIAIQHYEKDLGELLADNRAKGRTAASLVAADATALGDTRMRRRGSRRRRAVRSLLTRIAGIPGWTDLERLTVTGLSRIRPRLADAAVDLLVDREFWRGVADRPAPRRGIAEGTAPRTVAHLIDSVAFGGAEQVLLQLVGGLDPTIWRSVVVLDRSAVRLRKRLRTLGIATVALDLGGRPGPTRTLAIARVVRGLRPTIVHVLRPWPRAGRALLAGATLAGVTLAGSMAIIVTDHLAIDRASRKRRATEWLLGRRVATRIAVSPGVAGGLVRLGVPADRIRIVANGVAVGDDSGRPDERAATDRADGRRVVMIGQLRSQKGHETLLDALAALPADVTAVLAGEGPERERIESRIADLGLTSRVHLAGFVDDVPALLATADVVVLPSRFEGLPLAVLEGMAAGRPVVATNVAGTDQLIADGLTGLLVASGDAPALADAIERLLDDPVLARRLAAAGRAQVVERFSVDRMVRSVAAIYQEAIAHPTTGLDRSRPAATHPAEPTRESDRDRLLRPLDLRVLGTAPVPRTATALGRHRGLLEAGLAIVAGSVVPTTGPPSACDLAVARDPSPADLDRAATLLRPGGTLLVLSRRGGTTRRARATLPPGIDLIGRFRPFPSEDRALAWIQDGDLGALDHVMRLGLGRSRVRRSQRRLEAIRWRLAGSLGLESIAELAVGRAPGDPAMTAGPAIPIPGGEQLRWSLLTGGRRSHNRIVALGFLPGADTPHRVAITARVSASVPGLRREAAALRAVGALRPGGLPGVPQLVAERDDGDATVIVETAIEGTKLTRLLTEASFGRLAALTADWLRPLARPDTTSGDDLVELLIATFESAYRTVDPMLVDAVRAAVADLGQLPRAIEHRDLAPWNLRLLSHGGLGVLDWESADVDGIAGPDLHYALAYLAFDLAGATRVDEQVSAYRRLQDVNSTIGRAASRVLGRYAEEVGLDPRTMRRLSLVTWLIHARSELERMTGDEGSAPSADRLLGGLFVNLIRVDLEGERQDRRDELRLGDDPDRDPEARAAL